MMTTLAPGRIGYLQCAQQSASVQQSSYLGELATGFPEPRATKHRVHAPVAVLVSLAAALLPCAAAAAEYHVKVTGGAMGAGTEQDPFDSLQTATKWASPGDAVLVHEGTYEVHESIVIRSRGRREAPILIKALGSVTLRDPTGSVGVAWSEGLITFSEASWIVFDGFRVENAGWFSIYAIESSNIAVRNCTTERSGASGIAIWRSSSIRVLNNEVIRCCEQTNTNRGCQECISLASVDGFEVAYNIVRDSLRAQTGGEAIDAKDGSRNGTIHHNKVHNNANLGIYVDALSEPAENIEIYANEVFHNVTGIVLCSEGGALLKNVKVYNNLVYENGSQFAPAGYYPWKGAGGILMCNWAINGPLQDIHIFNNTVVRNAEEAGGFGWGIRILNSGISGLSIQNNILAEHNSGGIIGVVPSGALISHNLVFPVIRDAIVGTHTVQQDPLFGGSGAYDFSLGSGSPAIESGTNLPALPSVDYAGKARVAGAAIDIGALEANSTAIQERPPVGPTPTDYVPGANPWEPNGSGGAGVASGGTGGAGVASGGTGTDPSAGGSARETSPNHDAGAPSYAVYGASGGAATGCAFTAQKRLGGFGALLLAGALALLAHRRRDA
jgi:parallel beta-helix repeat protein